MNVIKENIINAKGKIDYTFTNDFVFRAILQRNKNVLTALICSLLHLPTDEVDVTITNTIELGNAFSDKDFILDIRVEMNDGRLIDLEMQMTNEYNWPERSISYADSQYWIFEFYFVPAGTRVLCNVSAYEYKNTSAV